MKSIYTDKIEEENLAKYLPEVNLSDRDKEIVTAYLNEGATYRELGARYDISGERIRQIIERFARKAHHYYKKDSDNAEC